MLNVETDAEEIWWKDFTTLCAELLEEAEEPVAAVCVSGIGPCFCLGAGMMALAALDGSELRDVAAAMSGEGASYEPNEQRADFYDRIYNGVYKEV